MNPLLSEASRLLGAVVDPMAFVGLIDARQGKPVWEIKPAVIFEDQQVVLVPIHWSVLQEMVRFHASFELARPKVKNDASSAK